MIGRGHLMGLFFTLLLVATPGMAQEHSPTTRLRMPARDVARDVCK